MPDSPQPFREIARTVTSASGDSGDAHSPEPLVDGFGRVVTNLRVSVTDRCNLRCRYCMPEEIQWTRRDEMLSFEEITRLASIFVHHLGITRIRLTGGEPTVRQDLPDLVSMLAELMQLPRRFEGSPGFAEDLRYAGSTGGLEDLSMTTNAIRLAKVAVSLKQSGLQRLNISLDTLDSGRFKQLTGRDRLQDVIDGIQAAADAGFSNIKLNTVVMRGVNDSEVGDIASFALERAIEPRFIEYMPLDGAGRWDVGQVVPAREILAAIAKRFPLASDTGDPPVASGNTPLPGTSGDRLLGPGSPALGTPDSVGARRSAPAHRYDLAGGQGSIGIIASVTEPFCAGCDRVRLTADGQLRTCLFALDEHDLKLLVREGSSDAEIAHAIRSAVATKWAGHQIGKPVFVRPRRSMVQIGG
ncbi:MAG: GTP 3',8-cyclase MoaA [Actinobacteria bacterium]|nr:GTP 3',8-cyclase MoaA [Actinomycetota bacterium]